MKKCCAGWLGCFSLVLGGCAVIKGNQFALPPAPRPAYLVEEYTLNTHWTAVKTEPGPLGSTRILLELPDHDPIIMHWFAGGADGPRPAVLVSPILGGHNRIANHFANYFAEHGYPSLVVLRPKDLSDNIHDGKALDRTLRNAVMRDRLALDWLQQQPQVDPQALGSFGISYGGIKNTILAGVDQRLKVNVFGLAGAEMASLISESNLRSLQEDRAIAMQKNGWNKSELRQAIRRTLRTEPLRFTPYINPHTTFLILARMDHTVPRKNGEILRRALREPKTLYLFAGHFSGVIYTGILLYPYIEKKVVNFFDEHLKPLAEEDGAPATASPRQSTPAAHAGPPSG